MDDNHSPTKLPKGVEIHPLRMNRDERGCFTEIFRENWIKEKSPIQWNVVSSEKNVLRGVHFHRDHADYLILIQGKAVFALKDLRPDSPTANLISMIEVCGENLQAIYIPAGVAHGFYFYTPSIHIYGVDHYWNHNDELGCRFDDPLLGITWPTNTPLISERDKNLPSLESIMEFVPNYC